MIENIHDNWDYLLSTCCSAPSSNRHYYNTCSKEELIEKLTLKEAQLLTCEKEVDRLNEYVQIMELQNDGKEKTKG